MREGSRIAILGYGSIVQNCVEAASILKTRDVAVTVADARFCKPLDTDLIKQLAKEHEFLITVEEGSIGGFGSHVSHYLSLSGILDGPLKVVFFLGNRNFILLLKIFLNFCVLPFSASWANFFFFSPAVESNGTS